MAVNRYHVEAWSLPLETSTRIVARVPFVAGSYKDPLSSQSGQGSITVRGDWDRLTDIVDPDLDIESLLVIFQNNTYVGAFFGTRTARDVTDDAVGLVTITGKHVASILDYGRVLNFDYPARPTLDPDWSWGAGASVAGFRNGGFEESEEIPGTPTDDVATDFEDQSLQGWLATRYFLPGFEENDATVKVNDTDSQAGTYSMEVNTGVARSGFRKLLRVRGGESYTFSWYCKSVTTGKRVLGLLDLHGGTVLHTNWFIDNGRAAVELANAAQGTGVTDNTWQQQTMTVSYPTFSSIADDNYKDVWLYVVFVGSGNGPLLRLDTFAGAGPGLGLVPWKPSDSTLVTVFEQDATHTDPLDTDSTVAAKVTTTAVNEGIKQRVEGLTPGRTYTFLGRIYHEAGSDQDFRVRIRRGGGEGVIATNTDTIPTATWATIWVTGLADQDTLIVDVTKDTAGTFWLDSFDLIEGLYQASWGDIQTSLLTDLTVTHIGESTSPPYAINAYGTLAPVTYLDYSSFDATTDSGGIVWAADPAAIPTVPDLVAYRAKRGKKLSLIANDGARMGYEYRAAFDPATSTVVLDWFNPYNWTTRTGGVGTNYVGTGVPEIRATVGVTSGPIVEQPAPANRVYVEGAHGRWNVRAKDASEAAVGTRMLYEGDVNVLGDDTLGQIARRTLDDRNEATTALKINIEPHDNTTIATPYVHFWPGDTYPIAMPGIFEGAKREVEIVTDFTPSFGRFTVEFDNRSYTSDPTKALVEAVRRLLERVDELDSPVDKSGLAAIDVIPGADFQYPEVLVASVDSIDSVKDSAQFVCDGVADEQTIIDASSYMSGWGRIHLAAGGYWCDDKLDLAGGRLLLLEGSGRQGSVLYMNGTTTRDYHVRMGEFSHIINLSLEDADDGATVNTAMLVLQGRDCMARDIWMNNEADTPGIRLENGRNISLLNSFIGSVSRTGTHPHVLVGKRATEALVQGNFLKDSAGHGVAVESGTSAAGDMPNGARILYNSIETVGKTTDSTYDFIHVGNPSSGTLYRTTIIGNVLYQVTADIPRHGIRLDGANIDGISTVVGLNNIEDTSWGASLSGLPASLTAATGTVVVPSAATY